MHLEMVLNQWFHVYSIFLFTNSNSSLFLYSTNFENIYWKNLDRCSGRICISPKQPQMFITLKKDNMCWQLLSFSVFPKFSFSFILFRSVLIFLWCIYIFFLWQTSWHVIWFLYTSSYLTQCSISKIHHCLFKI